MASKKEINDLLAEKWKQLSLAEKAPFEQEANAAKQQYEVYLTQGPTDH